MTSNQISYWNLQEQKRANLVNEDIKDKDVTSQVKRRKAQTVNDSINTGTNVVKSILGSIPIIGGLFKR